MLCTCLMMVRQLLHVCHQSAVLPCVLNLNERHVMFPCSPRLQYEFNTHPTSLKHMLLLHLHNAMDCVMHL